MPVTSLLIACFSIWSVQLRGATLIFDSDTGAANGIPTFSAIAAKSTTTEASLRAVLSQPHGRMPDFSLGRREQDALIGYILSLR